jgi:hypothetical protein
MPKVKGGEGKKVWGYSACGVNRDVTTMREGRFPLRTGWLAGSQFLVWSETMMMIDHKKQQNVFPVILSKLPTDASHVSSLAG